MGRIIRISLFRLSKFKELIGMIRSGRVEALKGRGLFDRKPDVILMRCRGFFPPCLYISSFYGKCKATKYRIEMGKTKYLGITSGMLPALSNYLFFHRQAWISERTRGARQFPPAHLPEIMLDLFNLFGLANRMLKNLYI